MLTVTAFDHLVVRDPSPGDKEARSVGPAAVDMGMYRCFRWQIGAGQ